jgi:hypothetical protein
MTQEKKEWEARDRMMLADLEEGRRILAECKLETAVSDAIIQAGKEGLTTNQINAIVRRLSSVRASY